MSVPTGPIRGEAGAGEVGTAIRPRPCRRRDERGLWTFCRLNRQRLTDCTTAGPAADNLKKPRLVWSWTPCLPATLQTVAAEAVSNQVRVLKTASCSCFFGPAAPAAHPAAHLAAAHPA